MESMCISRLLIMFAHSMGWALAWAIGGPRLWPRPLVSTIAGFNFIKYTRVVGIG